jgi:hypothetical protein
MPASRRLSSPLLRIVRSVRSAGSTTVTLRLIPVRSLLRIISEYNALLEENGALRRNLQCAHAALDNAIIALEQRRGSSSSSGTDFPFFT